MVQAMEAWFHADQESLQAYYGQGFRATAISQRSDIENISKADLFAGLSRAMRDCQKGEYSKSQDPFRILALIDPARVSGASRHAARLLQVLNRACA